MSRLNLWPSHNYPHEGVTNDGDHRAAQHVISVLQSNQGANATGDEKICCLFFGQPVAL